MPRLNLRPQTLGDRLRLLRESKGQTLRDVAKDTGIHNAYLSQLETGSHTNPSIEKVSVLAAHFGTTVGALLGEQERPFEPLWFSVLTKEERREVERMATFLLWKRTTSRC